MICWYDKGCFFKMCCRGWGKQIQPDLCHCAASSSWLLKCVTNTAPESTWCKHLSHFKQTNALKWLNTIPRPLQCVWGYESSSYNVPSLLFPSTTLNWAPMMCVGWCQQPQSCVHGSFISFSSQTTLKPNISPKLIEGAQWDNSSPSFLLRCERSWNVEGGLI